MDKFTVMNTLICECGFTMMSLRDGTLSCTNDECKNFKKRYKPQTMKLEEVDDGVQG